MMDPARWRRVEEVFHEVESLPAGLRAQRLQALCAGDAELQAEVESLLGAAETEILGPALGLV